MLTVCINIYSCALQFHCNNITEDVGNIYFYTVFTEGQVVWAGTTDMNGMK
jgi:hypothetical protein